MLFNSLHQILRSTVVQEKKAFPETPERCRAELVVFCLALLDAVIELCTHMVKRKIRKEIYIFVAQLRDRGFFAQLRVREFDCVKRRGMAKGAPYFLTTEKRLSIGDRCGASRGVAGRHRWCEQPHEGCKFFDITQDIQLLDRIRLRYVGGIGRVAGLGLNW